MKKLTKQLLKKLLFFKTFQTDQVIWLTFDFLHKGFGKNHLWLQLSSYLLIGLNNESKYEICIIIFCALKFICIWENLCYDSPHKHTEQSISARHAVDQSEVRQFHRVGLCERQVRDENCNRSWLWYRPWM